MTVTPTPTLDALLTRSAELIASFQEPNGAYPASPTFPAYRGYSWFRDGAFIADGMSAAGQTASASRFFDWCAMVVTRHADTIHQAVNAAGLGEPLTARQMLPARFRFDGSLGTDDWWDFQLDGYGTWLWAMASHTRRHGLNPSRWRTAAALTVDYLLASWRRPCYDWWEEHDEHVHVSTLGSVGAGLLACADSGLLDDDREHRARETVERIRALIAARATVDGHLTKWLGTDEVDGSLSALIAPLGFVDAGSPLASATLARIENQIMTDGGVYRFRADTFYGGGRWPLLTCFYGLAKAAAGDLKAARDALEWAAGTALPDGALPEQVDGHLLHPDHRQEWIDRWGPVATPLLWSHAMLLRLATEIDRIEESA